VPPPGHFDALRAHAAETVRYLSEPQKPERERAVCRAFLRCLGVTFGQDEIVAPAPEPVDVAFREARFQVRELMEPNRRRHDEWKTKLRRLEEARTLDDVEGVRWNAAPARMSRGELMAAVSAALDAKARRYGREQCSALDALVYVNLTMTRVLDPHTAPGDTAGLVAQGWRSVSVTFVPYGMVAYAAREAPGLFRSATGRSLHMWSDLEHLFDP
jgi:Putative endonuclease, protein of unknown function (DUF1780)